MGTDGSDTAARAVARAVDVAATLGAPLTIATAAANEARGREVVEAAAAAHRRSGVTITTAVLHGDAATALVDEALRGRYDLLVVGNKGMTGARRFLLGSVPNKVSHNVPCSLLIVRTT